MLEIIMRRALKTAGFAVVAAAILAGRNVATSQTAPGGAVGDYYLIVFDNPAEDKESESNRELDRQRAVELTSNAGVVSAQRYVASDVDIHQQQPSKYMAIYRIATGDLAATYRGFKKSALPPQDQPIDPKANVTLTYKAIRPEVSGSGPKSYGKGDLKTYEFFALTNPVSGLEAEYNDWYDHHHIPQVMVTPGFVSAQRLILSDVQSNSSAVPKYKYLVLYKIVTDDIAAVFDELDGHQARTFTMSPAFDGKTAQRHLYQTLGPLIDGNAARAHTTK